MGKQHIEFDYSKLRGRIIEKFGTMRSFAESMHMHANTLSRKMGNTLVWNQEEMPRAMDLLGENPKKIKDYFFVPKVQKIERKRTTPYFVHFDTDQRH